MGLNSRIFGISLATILLVVAVAVGTRMFGSNIPGLNQVGS